MARRIDVELTSNKDNGRWTWRAAEARQPKGEVDGSLLPSGAKVGDVLKVEAEFHLDGIEVIEVFAPKSKKDRTEDLLQLISRPISDDELVTEVRSGRRDRDDRGDRKRRDGGRGGRGDGPRGDRGDRKRPEGGRGDGGRGRGDRAPRRPQEEPRPKAKRLRAGRAHRNAALEAVPEQHRPIAEQVIKGGLPAVRTAIEKQNTEAASAGTPQVEVGTVLAIAERLVPVMQAAEWRDRADAALADLDELDLRDLRSVVVAADPTSKDEEARAVAEQLKTGLNARLERDQAAWLVELTAAVDGGRTIRALRLSSRPIKAGSPIPAELAGKLTAAAAAALAGDIASDRWAAVVDALAFSPVRGAVTPAGYPAEPTPELLETVKRVADRVPEIAKHFGIDPAEAASQRKRRPKRDSKKKAAAKPQRDSAASTSATPPAEAAAPVEAATPAEAAAPVEAAAPAEAAAPVAAAGSDQAETPADDQSPAAAESATIAEDAPAEGDTPVEPEAPVETAAPADASMPAEDVGTDDTTPPVEVAAPAEAPVPAEAASSDEASAVADDTGSDDAVTD